MRTFLSILFLALFSFQGVFAQFGDEDVSRYRKQYAFKYPEVVSFNQMGGKLTIVDRIKRIPDDSAGAPGVYYQNPYALEAMIEMYKRISMADVKADGYRIQIFAGSEMEKANDVKADYIEAFGDTDLEVYQKWDPPHFRVRVGDFLSRSDAMRELSTIRQIFPDAFLVSDKVFLPKFKKRVVQDPESLEETGDISEQ